MNDKDNEWLSSILVAIDGINIVVHALGLYLLLCIYKGRHKTPQHLFLINLSISTIIKNTFYAYQDVSEIASLEISMSKTSQDVQTYVHYTFEAASYDYYILSLIYLTCDRLMITLFHVRYLTLWNLRKTKILLLCTACLSLLVWLTSINILGKSDNWNIKVVEKNSDKIINIYLPTASNSFFVIFATFSYIAMFSRFRASCRDSLSVRISSITIFRRSKFFVAVLLVTSFLILLVLPNLLRTICTMSSCRLVPENGGFNFYFSISVSISDSVDGLIYVMFYAPVRNVFRRKLNAVLRFCNQKISAASGDVNKENSRTTTNVNSITELWFITNFAETIH